MASMITIVGVICDHRLFQYYYFLENLIHLAILKYLSGLLIIQLKSKIIVIVLLEN